MTRYYVKESLIKVCIKHNLCNDCTNKQYDKMLNLAAEAVVTYEGDKEATTTFIGNLADIIYVLTDDVSAYVLYSILEDWINDMYKEVLAS